MTTSHLKDCPFCGSSNLHSTGNGIGNEFIECADCGASGPAGDHAANYDELWNRRAASGDNAAPPKLPTPAAVQRHVDGKPGVLLFSSEQMIAFWQAAQEVARAPDTEQFQAGVREGYERAAKALGERAAGWRQHGEHHLEEEVLQCRSMLHDQKPAGPTAAKAGAA